MRKLTAELKVMSVCEMCSMTSSHSGHSGSWKVKGSINLLRCGKRDPARGFTQLRAHYIWHSYGAGRGQTTEVKKMAWTWFGEICYCCS